MALRFRRGNPAPTFLLESGEPGWDVQNKIFKVGDGVTPWSQLPVIGAISSTEVADAVEAYLLAHPVGDFVTPQQLAVALSSISLTPGQDGTDGAPGVNGRDGVDGAPGVDGTDGAPGVVRVLVVTGNETRPSTDFVLWVGGEVRPANMSFGDVWLSTADVAVETPPAPTGTAPTVTTAALGAITQGTAFTQTLQASGSTPLAWTVSNGTLPSGLTLTSAGVLSGTPTASGSYNFSVTATNSTGAHTRAYSGTVAAAPTTPTATERSIWGTTAPASAFTLNSDGGTGALLSNAFYTYGTPAYTGGQILGVKIWIPAGVTGAALTEGGKVFVHKRPTTGPWIASDAPSVAEVKAAPSANFTTLVAGQWNRVMLDTPIPLEHNKGILASYSFASTGFYIFSNSFPSGGQPFPALDGTRLAIADDGRPTGEGRSRYNDAWTNAHSYGIDLIVSLP